MKIVCFFLWQQPARFNQEGSDMDLRTIVILGISLAMDAFAVSVCKGLAIKKVSGRDMLKAALWFGAFQGIMPLVGYLAANIFAGYMESFASWVAFGLLAFIGGNMIREALFEKEEKQDAGMKAGEMFMLAVATSIDALAVGVTFSMVPVEIIPAVGHLANTAAACLIIAVETGIISAIGIGCGSWLGSKFKNWAEAAGGAVLILIGLKILLQHYGIF